MFAIEDFSSLKIDHLLFSCTHMIQITEDKTTENRVMKLIHREIDLQGLP